MTEVAESARPPRRFRRYPEYKSSGVAWLGDLPSHWKPKRFKFACSRSALYGANESAESYSLDGIRFLRTTDIDDSGSLVDDGAVYLPEELVQDYLLSDGDILISRSGTLGRALHYQRDVHGPCAYAGYLVRFVPKPTLDPRFAFYFTKSKIFMGWLSVSAIQSTIGNINGQKYGNLHLPDPALGEQRAIADFLDRETARIDQLVETKQRMVEVLEEREENNVVETIEHLFAESRAWKISHVCALKRGRFNQRPRNAPEFYDGDFPFLQTSDVAQAKKYISGHKQTLTDLGASVSVLFPSNSVLMAIAANVGDVAITKFDAYCPDSVIGFIPTTRLKVDYLYYALRSLRSSIATSSTSNAQDNTNISRLGALKMPVPKHATQDRVSRTLSVQENSTVRLVAMTHTSIERLREFRSALITAAVTGQIDVSTWGKHGTTGHRLDQIEEATNT